MLTVYEREVEIDPRGKRLNCSNRQRRNRQCIFQPLHEFQTVNICFISFLHKFHNMIYNLRKLEIMFIAKLYLFRRAILTSYLS